MKQLHRRTKRSFRVSRELVAGAALLVSGTAATAQDFSDRAVFDWSGLYAGVTVGVGEHTLTGIDTGRGPAGSWFGLPGARGSDSTDGFIGGVRVGYNLAFDPVVIGVEADFSAVDFSLYDDSNDIVTTSTMDWLGTVRGRVGVAVPDAPIPALVYGTGGLAVAQIEHTIGDTSTVLNAGQFGPNSVDETRTGYAVGAGVEVAVTDNVLVGLEYLYMDFGRTTVNGICVVCFNGGTPGTPYVFDFDTTVQTIRLNVSWKFGR